MIIDLPQHYFCKRIKYETGGVDFNLIYLFGHSSGGAIPNNGAIAQGCAGATV